ncbi:hypothetical protein N7524_008171 [Penicillium chrysogenum]|nr:hypothetical protein N7524_008171 [Penicillium chrysogenum]
MNVFFAPAALPPAWRRRRLIDALELRFAATGALRYRAVTLNLFPYAGLAAKAHHRHPGIGGAIEHIKGCPCGSGSTRDKTGDDRGIRGILRCWGTYPALLSGRIARARSHQIQITGAQNSPSELALPSV